MGIASDREQKQPVTVLLVDDDAINLVVLEQLLKRAGFQVLTASSGEEALKTVVERKVDLIMADINMPDMDGVELSVRIRKDLAEPKRSLPILAITAYNDAAEDDRFRKAGITDILHKPVPFETLKTAVQSLVDSG